MPLPRSSYANHFHHQGDFYACHRVYFRGRNRFTSGAGQRKPAWPQLCGNRTPSSGDRPGGSPKEAVTIPKSHRGSFPAEEIRLRAELSVTIVQGKVPDDLARKRLVALDLSSMIAGTKYRAVLPQSWPGPDILCTGESDPGWEVLRPPPGR